MPFIFKYETEEVFSVDATAGARGCAPRGTTRQPPACAWGVLASVAPLLSVEPLWVWAWRRHIRGEVLEHRMKNTHVRAEGLVYGRGLPRVAPGGYCTPWWEELIWAEIVHDDKPRLPGEPGVCKIFRKFLVVRSFTVQLWVITAAFEHNAVDQSPAQHVVRSSHTIYATH